MSKTKKQTKAVANELENELLDDLQINVSTQEMNLDFLRTSNPLEFINENDVSKKYDAEREPKVQAGLQVLQNLTINGEAIPEELLLLAKWWENKPARNFAKTHLDEVAFNMGLESAEYLQDKLGDVIETISYIQTAIDRLKYVRTFYKPRGEGKRSKVKMVQVRIDGKIYQISELKLNSFKTIYQDPKELKARVLEEATLVEDIAMEL